MLTKILAIAMAIGFLFAPIAAFGQHDPKHPRDSIVGNLVDSTPCSGSYPPSLRRSQGTRIDPPSNKKIGSRPTGGFYSGPLKLEPQTVGPVIPYRLKLEPPEWPEKAEQFEKLNTPGSPKNSLLEKRWTNAKYLTFETAGFEVRERDIVIESPSITATTEFDNFPLTFQASYGKGNSEREQFDLTPQTESSRIASIEVFQARTGFQYKNVFLTLGGYVVSSPNDQEFIQNDSLIEFSGSSVSKGFDVGASITLKDAISLSTGYSRVLDAAPTDSDPNSFIDMEPYETFDAAVKLSGSRIFDFIFEWRNQSRYGVDWSDSGGKSKSTNTFRVSAEKRIHSRVELNLSIDNLFNSENYETVSLFRSGSSEAFPPFFRSVFENKGFSRRITLGFILKF